MKAPIKSKLKVLLNLARADKYVGYVTAEFLELQRLSSPVHKSPRKISNG